MSAVQWHQLLQCLPKEDTFQSPLAWVSDQERLSLVQEDATIGVLAVPCPSLYMGKEVLGGRRDAQ